MYPYIRFSYLFIDSNNATTTTTTTNDNEHNNIIVIMIIISISRLRARRHAAEPLRLEEIIS